jgi:hypothetical protein
MAIEDGIYQVSDETKTAFKFKNGKIVGKMEQHLYESLKQAQDFRADWFTDDEDKLEEVDFDTHQEISSLLEISPESVYIHKVLD